MEASQESGSNEFEDSVSLTKASDDRVSDNQMEYTDCTVGVKPLPGKGYSVDGSSDTSHIKHPGNQSINDRDRGNQRNTQDPEVLEKDGEQIDRGEKFANSKEDVVSECNPIILNVRGNATDLDSSIFSGDCSKDLFDADTDCSASIEKRGMKEKSASVSTCHDSISVNEPAVSHTVSASSSCNVYQTGNSLSVNNVSGHDVNTEPTLQPACSILLTMVSKASIDKSIDSLAIASHSDSTTKLTFSGDDRSTRTILARTVSPSGSVEKPLVTRVVSTSKSLISSSVAKVLQRSGFNKLINILPACTNSNSALSVDRNCVVDSRRKSMKRLASTTVSCGVSTPAVKIMLAGSQSVPLPKTVVVNSSNGNDVSNTLNKTDSLEVTTARGILSSSRNNSENALYYKSIVDKIFHLATLQEGMSLQETLKSGILKANKSPRVNLEKLFVCTVCGDEFYQQDFLRHHMDRKVFVLVYDCARCKEKLIFYNKCKFWLHLRNEGIEQSKLENEKSYFNFKPYLDSIEEESSTVVKCKFCSKDFSPEDFKTHLLKVNTSSSPIYCQRCCMSLANRCALLAHQTIHEAGSREVMCPECGETFSQSDGLPPLFNHLDSCYHFNSGCVFPCQCGEFFKTCSALHHHMISSHMKLLLRCHKCFRCFSTFDLLFSHCTNVHNAPASASPSRLAFCQLCKQGFENHMKLKDHFEEHAYEQSMLRKKMLSCFLCKSIFSTSFLLNKHIKDSHSHRPNRCTICCGLFESRQNLVEHIVSKKCSPCMLPQKFHECIDAPARRQEETIVVTRDTYKQIFDTPIFLKSMSVRQLLDKIRARESGHGLSEKTVAVSSRNSFEKSKDNTKYQCHACKICIVGTLNYDKHLALHSSRGLVRHKTDCGICKKTVDDGLIKSHMESHQKRGIIVCSLCHSRNFDSMNDALQHSLNLCHYKVVENDGAAYVKSNESHNVTADEMCEVIDDEEENNQEKSKHEKSSVFPCLICGLTFSSKQAKDDHVTRIHDGTRTLYFCLLCKKKGVRKYFAKKNLITKHISQKHRIIDLTAISSLIREEEQNVSSGHVVPTESSNQSSEASPLKRLRLATEGDFVCGKCGLSMEDSKIFEKHIAIHNPRKEPQCPECGLCFTVVAALKKHLFMVHKIKEMDEYLKKKGMLETWEEDNEESEDEVHEESVDVLSCGRPFESSNSSKETKRLGQNNSKSRGGDFFECNVCYRQFSSEAVLKSHMRNHGMAFIRSRRFDKN